MSEIKFRGEPDVKTLIEQDRKIYEMQIRDKACTICINVSKGGKLCKECIASRHRKHWRNAYSSFD